MSKAKNLELRGSTYYARITTPKTLAQLRHQAGRTGAREIKRSLGTGDRRQAEILLAGFMAEAHQAFATEEAELRAAIAAGMAGKRLHTGVIIWMRCLVTPRNGEGWSTTTLVIVLMALGLAS